jgi:hypothetical protein
VVGGEGNSWIEVLAEFPLGGESKELHQHWRRRRAPWRRRGRRL